MLVIVQPGAGDIHWAIALSLGNAVAVALYQIATRSLAARDHSDTGSIYSPVVGVLILLPALPFVWSEPQSWFTWVLLAATGVFGGVGHWILIIAHRYAPASLLAPFSYTHILWMTLAGYLVFGHLPGMWTGVGALIVIASGLYVFHRERVVKDSLNSGQTRTGSDQDRRSRQDRDGSVDPAAKAPVCGHNATKRKQKRVASVVQAAQDHAEPGGQDQVLTAGLPTQTDEQSRHPGDHGFRVGQVENQTFQTNCRSVSLQAPPRPDALRSATTYPSQSR